MGLSLPHGPLWVNFASSSSQLPSWKSADQSVKLNTNRLPIYALPPVSHSPSSSLIPSAYSSIQTPNVCGKSRKKYCLAFRDLYPSTHSQGHRYGRNGPK